MTLAPYYITTTMINILKILSILSLSLVSSCNEQSALGIENDTSEGKYILFSPAGSNLADVFDMNNKRISIITIPSTDIQKSSETSEFSGPLIFCGNSEFYCMKSGITVVIPRKKPFPSSWSASGVNCNIVNITYESILTIYCFSNKKQGTKFDFDYVRGIISYKRLCRECESDVYELRSKSGLFGMKWQN